MTISMQEIPIENIYVSETATQNARRKHFRKGELEDLISSIATHGVLQPIILRPRPTEGGYTHELVAGERRFLAADEAGLKTIPSVVRELTDEQVLEVQLIENLQRKDLHPMQEAEGYQELMTKHGHAVDELHDRVGKSKSYVYGRLKLLALCKNARDAFYDDRISASVAVLIARIPSTKLQDQALKDLTYDPDSVVSAREAGRLIRDSYMLRLKGAPFPTGDPELYKQAGPCNACPKRTGNQPELFGDVESADVCTDPICFGVKRKEHGDRVIREAKKAGQPVIAGKDLKKIMPYGEGRNHLSGYSRLDAKNYSDGKSRTNRAIVGKDVEVTLIQMPKTGEVVEVVKDSVIRAALPKQQTPGEGTYQRQQREQARKIKIEKAYRKALYTEVRPHLPPPSLRLIARKILDRMENDVRKLLVGVRGIEVKETKQSWGGAHKDFGAALSMHVNQLPEDDLPAFVNDAIYASELQVWSHNAGHRPKALEEAAGKVPGLSAKQIRHQVTVKTKPSKKKKTKKASKKKAAKKNPARRKAKA